MSYQLSEQSSEEDLLQRAESYLKQAVAPQAAEIDRDAEALASALQGLGDRALLALKVPPQWGGRGWSEVTFRRFQIAIARYSGALAFLQTQHQSAGSLLASGHNQALKAKYLPEMATGKKLVGVGFSQLRRPGKPLIIAQPTTEGYKLSGTVPWITGYGFFADFIIGANLPDGRELYGIVPLRDETGLSCSQLLELSAMNSTRTISAQLHDWYLSSDRVVTIRPSGNIQRRDRQNVLHHSFFALGSAWASLDLLQAVAQQKQLDFIQSAFEALRQELTCCEEEIFASLVLETKSPEEKLKLRAQAIHLSGRCVRAAIAASSGMANMQEHPIQRIYREALMF